MCLYYADIAFSKQKQLTEQSKRIVHYVISVVKREYDKFLQICHSVGGQNF